MVNSSSILFEKEIQYYLPLKTKEMQTIGSWLFIEPLVKLINPLHPFQPEKARFLLLAIKEVRAYLVNNHYGGIHKRCELVGGGLKVISKLKYMNGGEGCFSKVDQKLIAREEGEH